MEEKEEKLEMRRTAGRYEVSCAVEQKERGQRREIKNESEHTEHRVNKEWNGMELNH